MVLFQRRDSKIIYLKRHKLSDGIDKVCYFYKRHNNIKVHLSFKKEFSKDGRLMFDDRVKAQG